MGMRSSMFEDCSVGVMDGVTWEMTTGVSVCANEQREVMPPLHTRAKNNE